MQQCIVAPIFCLSHMNHRIVRLASRTSIAVLLIVCSAVAAANAQTDDNAKYASWKTTRVDDAAFEVDFPSKPQTVPLPDDLAEQEIRGRMYMYESPRGMPVLLAE